MSFYWECSNFMDKINLFNQIFFNLYESKNLKSFVNKIDKLMCYKIKCKVCV